MIKDQLTIIFCWIYDVFRQTLDKNIKIVTRNLYFIFHLQYQVTLT